MKDLRQMTPPERRKALYFLWNLLPPVCAALLVGVASLYYATGRFYQPMFFLYLQNRWILSLNLVPVLLLAVLVWMASGRAWVGFLTTSVLTMAATWVSFFKLTFRNDPLLFEDILLAREAGAMAGQYQPFVTSGMVVVGLFIVGMTVLFALCTRWRPNKWVRLGGVTAVLTASLLLVPTYRSKHVYLNLAANSSLISIWSATDIYVSKGFVYPFLHSITESADDPAECYTASYARTVLAAHDNADIAEGKKVSVIGIMLEAFQDFSRFGTPELAYDLYAPYHALEAEGVSGTLLTNIFAGGTVDTERGFLTGFSTLGSLRAPTNSYPWYFRSQGYTVEGFHPCYAWFYNRSNINQNLGFENYYFVENHFAPMTGGGVGLDDLFFPELMAAYEANLETGKPYFNFSVTYQGHGPYDSGVCWWGERGDFVREGVYTDEQQYILDNYFGSVADTIERLAALADDLRQRDDPVVLVLFGDHNPWMGDANSVYEAMGLNLDLSTQEGFFHYYSTRYLIWANPAARAVLGREVKGDGPDVGPYFLMAEVFRQLGWEGPAFLQVAQAAMERVPLVHTTGLYFEDGQLTKLLTPEGWAVTDDYLQAQYYWRKHFAYADVWKE